MTRSESELFPDPLVSGRAKPRGGPRMTLRLGSASEGAAGLLARRALEGAIPLNLSSDGDCTAVSVSGGGCLSRGTSSTRNRVARLSPRGPITVLKDIKSKRVETIVMKGNAESERASLSRLQ